LPNVCIPSILPILAKCCFLTEVSPEITQLDRQPQRQLRGDRITGLQDYTICLYLSVDRLPNVRILSILSILSIVLFLTKLSPAITSWIANRNGNCEETGYTGLQDYTIACV